MVVRSLVVHVLARFRPALTRRALRGSLDAFFVSSFLLSLCVSARAEGDGRPHARRPRSTGGATSVAPSETTPKAATTPRSTGPDEAAAVPAESGGSSTPPRSLPPQRSLPSQRPEEHGGGAALPTLSGGAFFPPLLLADPSRPPPLGYRLESEMNSGLFWGGLIVFGVSYGSAIAYGAANGFSEGLGVVAVPLIGPFLAIGNRELGCTISQVTPGSDPASEVNVCQKKLVNEAISIATLSALGVIEVFGGGLSLIGLLDRKHTWVRTDLGAAELKWSPRLLPTGLAVEGTF